MNKETIPGTLLIYGATGYTGTMICHEAARRGINFEIAGRNAEKLSILAVQLQVPFHAFEVNDITGWQQSLDGKTALLNVAGPFSETAEMAMEACLMFKVHYFDITAEVDIYRLAHSKDEAAKAAGIMILSGAGLFATYDPLVLHTARRIKNPVSLRTAFKYSGGFTPGSVASSANIISAGLLIRINGEIQKLSEASPASFDFGNGPEVCFPTPLGGIVLCYKSTGIPNIEEYFQMALPAQTFEDKALKVQQGQTVAHAEQEKSKIVAEVTDADGTRVRSMIEMPDGYMPTVTSSLEIVSRALRGLFKLGFQSPASAYGEELLNDLIDIELIDL
jgi:short subunit dehydrogenase-like uncharacterized protein